MINFPPGLILVIGALFLPLIRRFAGAAAMGWTGILLAVATLAGVWMIPDNHVVQWAFLDGLVLTPVTKNPLGIESFGNYLTMGPDGGAILPVAPTKVFATIFSLMAAVGGLFALNQDRKVELPAGLVYAGSAVCVTFAGDIFTLFVFWELMAVGSTIVVWAGGTERANYSGMRYALVHFVGGVIMMAGIVSQAFPLMAAGVADPLALHHYAFGPMGFEGMSFSLAEPGGIAAWLVLIGILINAAAPPFGSWLPDAYPEASESGTVFLSAFTTKTAVYVLMILFAGADLLIYVGSLMAVYGIVYAILENDMRRILAYSICNQVGFMVCGIGIGTMLSLNGASAHAFAHIIYKALLLMSAGSVLFATGRRKCTELGGLYHTMPVTMWCGIIGALAISSFPLTSGFTTKSMITTAAAGGHYELAWLVLAAASAGVFLHAGIKFPWFVFFQKDRGLRPPEVPWNMQAAMIIFAVLCVVLGIPGIFPMLYDILPYPLIAHAYAPDAYSASHVVSQLQLLLYSGLAFFLLLPMLKRTETITIDFDWTYRKLGPGIWKYVLAPPIGFLGMLWDGLREDLPDALVRLVRVSHDETRVPGLREWTQGAAMIVITGMLFVYLIIGFNQ